MGGTGHSGTPRVWWRMRVLPFVRFERRAPVLLDLILTVVSRVPRRHDVVQKRTAGTTGGRRLVKVHAPFASRAAGSPLRTTSHFFSGKEKAGEFLDLRASRGRVRE